MRNRTNGNFGRNYVSPAERRKRRADRQGYCIITACLLAFAAMFYTAYSIDKARGISVDESLSASGL